MNNLERRNSPEDSLHEHRREVMRLLAPSYVTICEKQAERGGKNTPTDSLIKMGALLLDTVINVSAASANPAAVALRIGHTWAGPAAARTIARRFK